MGVETAIQWCHHTFNPWWGCQRVSPGCEHCYAEAQAKRYGHAVWGPEKTTPRRFFGDKHWTEPLKWARAAGEAGERRRVFCASMADVFEDRRDLDAGRSRLFDLIESTPELDWLLLTKRPEHMHKLAPLSWVEQWPANVWAGATAEDQQRADERAAHLRMVPALVRFLSVEPMIGPTSRLPLDGISWVIIGGESGPGARPFDLAWARSAVAQCRASGAAPFVKQYGARPVDSDRRVGICNAIDERAIVAGKALGVYEEPRPGDAMGSYLPFNMVMLRDRKGGDPDEWEPELRVREFPKAAA